MKLQLVTPERPVSFRSDVIPTFLREGVAIDYCNLICIRKGRAVLSVNLKRVLEVPGVTLLLFPGDVVKVEEASDDFELEYMLCTESVLQEAASGMEHLVYNVMREHFYTDRPEAMEIAGKIISLGQSLIDDEDGKYAHDIMVHLLRCMFLYYNKFLIRHNLQLSLGRSRSDELFGLFMYQVGAHFKESRDVNFYAELMHITPKYLTNIVRTKTGMNAKAAIDEYTVMQIKLSLQTSERPVKDIAWDYNFSSPAFFCEYFKRHTGMTPAAFREL